MPHDIIRSLITVFKNNGLAEDVEKNEEEDDSNVLLKHTKLMSQESPDALKKNFKID